MAFQVVVAFRTRGDLEFQAECSKDFQQASNFDRWISVLNNGDRFLPQPRFFAQGFLAQFLNFPDTPNGVPNLPGISGRTAHGKIMR